MAVVFKGKNIVYYIVALSKVLEIISYCKGCLIFTILTLWGVDLFSFVASLAEQRFNE